MGKINNYQVSTPAPGDKLLGSADSNGNTKNFTAQSIADLGRSSSVYRAFLTQTGISNPVATLVPGNTITGVWSYVSAGNYVFISTTEFGTKTAVIVSLNDTDEITYTTNQVNSTTIALKSYDAGVLTNSLINNLFVEITTYDL